MAAVFLDTWATAAYIVVSDAQIMAPDLDITDT